MGEPLILKPFLNRTDEDTNLPVNGAVLQEGRPPRVLDLTTINTLIAKLKETQNKGKAYLSASLVIVDETDYLPVDSREAYLFFQFISYYYEKSSTIITSKKNFSDWQELFGDAVIAKPSLIGSCNTAG